MHWESHEGEILGADTWKGLTQPGMLKEGSSIGKSLGSLAGLFESGGGNRGTRRDFKQSTGNFEVLRMSKRSSPDC